MNRKEYVYTAKVTKYIEQNGLIDQNDKIVIGLSGGADSVCLLRMLKNVSQKTGMDICAVHVHHGIRGKSADEDELFCKNLCESEGVPFKAVRADIPAISAATGESIEECARRIRYDILREEAGRSGNSKIAVAHHMDDQAETVLFRMFRGTGVKGLSAMRPKNGIIIRPLLCLTKDEILDYLKICGQPFCTDETNGDDAYSRNHIRLNILPQAKEICPEVSSHIASLSEEAAELTEYVEKCAQGLVGSSQCQSIRCENESIIKEKRYSAPELSSAEKIVAMHAIRQIIDGLTHSLKDITREHIESVYHILESSGSKRADLPGGLRVYRDGKEIVFRVESKTRENNALSDEEFSEMIGIPGKILLPDGREMISEYDDSIDTNSEIPQNHYTKWIDYDKINAGFCVRYRRQGDFLIVNDTGDKKSLSRYMIDEKISKSARDSVPVLACGSEIIWVIGYRLSARFKVSGNTKKVIRLEVKGVEHE